MNARDVFASSTVSQIPVVPTVTCPACHTPWNAKAFTVREGRCTCGAPLGASDEKTLLACAENEGGRARLCIEGYGNADTAYYFAREAARYAQQVLTRQDYVSVTALLPARRAESNNGATQTLDDEPARPGRLTRQEVLEGLADRGVDTWDDYHETK